MDRDYYCNYKFRFLKVDLEAFTTLNCHASQTHGVDVVWLKNNPGQLFNTDINVQERHMMLANQRCPSCEQNCWPAEDRGQTSPRLLQGGPARTHTEPVTNAEIFDITVGSDCNLSCSYCCKEYSSSWRRDIANNGSYNLPHSDQRYQLNSRDKLLLKTSQQERQQTERYQLMLNEIRWAAEHLKTIIVTGGEPFLNNSLIQILSESNINPDCEVKIYTGMGVDHKRFERMLHKLKHIPNLTIIVSAENIGADLEFNRYGVSWPEFDRKIKLLESLNIVHEFQSTITNLTVHGFANFVKYYTGKKIVLTFAYQPSLMAVHVMDDRSKQSVLSTLSNIDSEFLDSIQQNLMAVPDERDVENLRAFLPEFVKRRNNLTVDIFPESFRNWVGV